MGVGARARQRLALAGGWRARRRRRRRRRERDSRRRSRRTATSRYSRLVCPRRLTANTRYHAFVVPTFETGRLAGPGPRPGRRPRTRRLSAWEDYPDKPAGATLPYYHRWYFRTGDQGDFEYLVPHPRATHARRQGRRPRRRPPAPRQQHPRRHRPAVRRASSSSAARCACPTRRSPPDEIATRNRFENWDQSPPAAAPYPQPFQSDMAAFVNLPDDYAVHTAEDANAASGLDLDPAGDPDPLITSPLYGRWHALTQRLLRRSRRRPARPGRQLGPRAQPRPSPPPRRRVRHAGHPVAPRAVHGCRVGPDRRRARGQPPHPAGPARASSSRQSWWSPRSPRSLDDTARSGCCGSPRPRTGTCCSRDAAGDDARRSHQARSRPVPAPSSGQATVRHRLDHARSPDTTLLSATAAPIATRPARRTATAAAVRRRHHARLAARAGSTPARCRPRRRRSPRPASSRPMTSPTPIDIPPLPSLGARPVADWLLDLLRRRRWLPWLVLALAIAARDRRCRALRRRRASPATSSERSC